MVYPLKAKQTVFYRSVAPPYGRVTSSRISDGYTQKPPYTIDTVYYLATSQSDGNVSADQWDWHLSDLRWGSFPSQKVAASNKAYQSFIGKLGDSSSFGASLIAERKQTYDLVVGTIVRALQAARAVRKLDLAEAARLLGVPYAEKTVTKTRYTHRKDGSIKRRIVNRKRVFTLPSGRQVQKTMANGWLMYSYGVKPLTQDLYNGMDVLQRPFPWSRVRGSGTGSGNNGWNTKSSSGHISVKKRVMQVSVRCSAEVSVVNPNLFLANRMGLTNPVAIANEAIPFSFVVDWFSNLSDVIGSMSDFGGLTIRKPSTTYVLTQSETTFDTGPLGRDPFSTSKSRSVFTRGQSIPMPQLQFAYERFSWQRGTNAISLLVQLLPKK